MAEPYPLTAPTRAPVLSALSYLAVTSTRNQLRRQVRRLRSPRYVVALVAGAVYMWWFLVRPAHQGGAAALVDARSTIRLASLGFALLVAKWWLAGSDERALAFTPAEIHLLFPAPLSRRALVMSKLLRAQMLILFNTVLWSVLLRGEGLQLGAWRRALGVWMLFSTLYLHRLGAALSGASATRHGMAGRRRQIIPIVVFGLAAGTLGWAMVQAGPVLARAWTFGPMSVIQVLSQQLDAPRARAVLTPFRLLLAPALAPDGRQWAAAIGPALGILALHVLWVLRTDSAFEEAAIEASERIAARRAATRAGAPIRTADATPVVHARRRTIPLAPDGPAVVAILWKNGLTAIRAGTLVRQLGLLGALAIAAFVLAMRDERVAEVALVIASVWGGLLVLAGPLWVRFDLRQDLPHLAVLRAWPLSGREIVVAQIASSTVALTLFQLALLACLLAVSFFGRLIPLSTGDRIAVTLAAALALPGLNAAGLTVQNAAALLFPGWVRLGGASRGVEAMGQSLLSLAASAVVLALMLAIPGAAAAGIVYSLRGTGSLWTFIPAALSGTALVGVELWPVMHWLGRVFERTEPSAVT